MSFKFLKDENFNYLCHGLTLDAQDKEVLDNALCAFDEQTGLPSEIVSHNKTHGFAITFPYEGEQIILNLNKIFSPKKGNLSLTSVAKHKNILNITPALHINLHSPTLDIPQRVEIPLRYVLRGLPSLVGTYMVYLHALQVNGEKEFVYYGITKRGWMQRFQEHTRSALKGKSRRKFAALLRDSSVNRASQVWGDEIVKKSLETDILTGMYHVVCTAGRSKRDALEAEAHLIAKHSYMKESGLNMIQGQWQSKDST